MLATGETLGLAEWIIYFPGISLLSLREYT